MMKVNGQYSSEYVFNSLNFAPCGPSNDLADRCAARGGIKLESPGVVYTKFYAWTLFCLQISTREQVSDLLKMEGLIDLIIPRGSKVRILLVIRLI